MPIDMTFTQRRSRFVYGTGSSEVSWTTLLPIRPWNRRTPTIGGHLVAGSGVPASYVIRRDHILLLPIPFLESEWESLLGMLAWGQSSETFRWYPDALETGEYYLVWLDSPRAGEDITPTRSTEFPKALEITVGIRTVSGNPWLKEFFNYEALPPDVPSLGVPTYLLSDGSRGEPATAVAGTYMDIGIKHGALVGGEAVEVWMAERVTGSGEFEEPAAGVYRGVTDFSEYDVGLGIPEGLTFAWIHRNQFGPPTLAPQIQNDPEEGNYFAISYTPLDDGFVLPYMFFMRVDAWDEIKNLVSTDTMEMLARIGVPPTNPHSGNPILWGPGYRMTFTPEEGDISDIWSGNLARMAQISYVPSGPRWEFEVLNRSGGGTENTSLSNLQAAGVAIDFDTWVWIRSRWIRNGGNIERYAKVWVGSLEDEPPGWLMTSDGIGSSNAYDTVGDIGFVIADFGNRPWSAAKISHVAFTTDPINYPPMGEAPTGEAVWFKAAEATASGLTQVVRTTIALDPGKTYDIRLRYRLGSQFSPGAVFGGSGQPAATWPSISSGEESTSSDPATLDSAVWSRTAADAERVTLTITPANETEDILVWRKPGNGTTWTQIDTISGPHGATETYVDETIDGETLYDYAVSTGTGARGPEVEVWTGPVGIPEYLFDVPFGAGYQVGFDPSDVAYETELQDRWDDAGGFQAFTLRATASAGETEVESGTLNNVPAGGTNIPARLRHKLTSFTVDDYGQFGDEFSVFVPESE